MDEIVGEFLVESYENLDRLDRDMLALEQQPGDRRVLGSIFRTVHTIKGTCGFLGFGRLEALSHGAENLLGRLRDGDLEVTEEIASTLLVTGDALRATLETIEQTGAEGDDDHTQLLDRLGRLQEGRDEGGDDRGDDRLGTLLVRSGKVTHADIEWAIAAQRELGDQRRLGELLVDSGRIAPEDLGAVLEQQASARGGSVADATVRVEVGLLDDLMSLVGELVLVRNQIVGSTAADGADGVTDAVRRLDLVTTELQEGVTRTRMQPIGAAWSKLPRLVRDLAVQCGKRVTVEVEGQDTELDRSIIEAIRDPLTHLARNAVDHGIEPPLARAAAGKPAEGLLRLRARHEGGQVTVEVIDDGRGVDLDAVARKAVERGVATPEDLARMSEAQLVDLVFAPGFSTAVAVTTVSGRGVGMDVVQSRIGSIGGSVDLLSRPGFGTTARIRIPLTLAIVPALMVDSAGERYAIPQVNLLELVQLDGSGAGIVEELDGAPTFRLRGSRLPLVDLRRELRNGPRVGTAADVVVLRADDRRFGLVVDGVGESSEIVVKPLDRDLQDAPLFAGATILGDGAVGLILNVVELARRATSATRNRDRDRVATLGSNGS